MKATLSVIAAIRKLTITACTALVLGSALLPSVASAYDGTITFTGVIYESPCDIADNNVTCNAGDRQQTMDLALLQKNGHMNTINSNINYQVMSESNIAIVTVSYL